MVSVQIYSEIIMPLIYIDKRHPLPDDLPKNTSWKKHWNIFHII